LTLYAVNFRKTANDALLTASKWKKRLMFNGVIIYLAMSRYAYLHMLSLTLLFPFVLACFLLFSSLLFITACYRRMLKANWYSAGVSYGALCYVWYREIQHFFL
jgi:hypothetical protein